MPARPLVGPTHADDGAYPEGRLAQPAAMFVRRFLADTLRASAGIGMRGLGVTG